MSYSPREYALKQRKKEYLREFLKLYTALAMPNSWVAKQLGGVYLNRESELDVAVHCLFCSLILYRVNPYENRPTRPTMHVFRCAETWAREISCLYYLDKLSEARKAGFDAWLLENQEKDVGRKWLRPIFKPDSEECIAIECMCHAFASLTK